MAITTCVHVWVLPEAVDAFIEATIENHDDSVQEPGNLRFDVCRDASDPCRFMLYEAYVDEASAAAHKNTAHYGKWRDTVAPMMARPREGVRFHILAH
ncbi:MAG TPA: antibiotic biosynthesis monooxygenase [Prolixibacteraceae bacterium]|nr:antibiotic biosynthesis monooxygenase [Prolixibacteraceae bacterium]